MSESVHASWRRYGLALLLVALASVLSWALWVVVQPFPLFFFIVAVIICAWYGGLRPAVVAGSLSALVITYGFLAPNDALFVMDLLRLALFVGLSALVGALAESRNRVIVSEAGLRQSYEVTLANIGDAVIATDDQGRITFLNAVAEALTGWPAHEVAGRPLGDVFPVISERAGEPVEDPVAKVLRQGDAVGPARDTVLVARDGRTILINDSGAPIRDANGRIAGVVLVVRDVTAPRRNEEAMTRLAALVESSEDAIVSLAPDGRIMSWNAGAARLFGYQAEDAVGQPGALVVPSERAGELAEIAAKLQRGEPTLHLETVRMARDGRRFECSVSVFPVRDARGQFLGASLFAHEISARKQMEQALREGERRFRQLAETIPHLVWTGEPDGTLDYFNQRTLQYAGLSLDQLLGRGWEPVVHPDDLPGCLERWEHAIRTGETYEVEYRLRRDSDGAYRWHIGRGEAVRGPDGRVVKWYGTCTDIDDRKRAEEDNSRLYREAQDARREAEAADRAKDRFLAVLSHELRTPLTPVLVSVSAMLEDPDTPQEIRGFLEMTRRSIEMEARLIDDLLDVTRISQGKLRLSRHVVDAHALVRQAVEICRDEIGGRRLRLTLDLAAEHCHVEADPARLQQTFWNLIKNAVKFTPSEGTLSIRSWDRDDGGRKQLLVEVRDSGVGIAPDVLPKIFNAFEQGEASVTRQFGGLGLGLAVSRSLAEAHGGRLTAASEGRERGAAFTLELGASPTPPTECDGVPQPPPEVRAPSTVRVLLAEDNEESLRVMARLLRRRGYEVATADSVASALAEAERAPFDLLVSDIGLPDGSGLDLIRALRARRPVAGIALSGFGMEDDLRRSLDAGFLAHLTKPIDFATLEATILQVAGSRQVAEQVPSAG